MINNKINNNEFIIGILGRNQLQSRVDRLQDRVGSVLYQALDSINPYRETTFNRYINPAYQHPLNNNAKDYDYNSQYFS